jgi:exodeoxyribonuclease III
MRVISLSVDGIAQAANRGLYDWLATQMADIICLQDLRALEPELDNPRYQLPGYFAYVFDSGVKGKQGVAIYTRYQPKALIYGLGFSSGVDMEGRYVQLDYPHLSIGSLLAPQAVNAETLAIKSRFFADLQAWMHKITRKRRQFIFCGNWAVAPSRRDLENGVNHQTEPGCLPEEQQWFSQICHEIGYADAYRLVHKNAVGEECFNWWPSGLRGEGDGWRTDLQIISESLAPKVEYASHYHGRAFSSHAPLIVDYDLDPEDL